jgi:pimeloyl-ACP methyl ester carboxylesterase
VPAAFFERILAESVKLPARLWRALLDGLLAFEDAADLPRIAAPTLLLWGDHDALFPREDQDRLAVLIPGARLRIYTETGHCPNWERPERVAADLVEFTAVASSP